MAGIHRAQAQKQNTPSLCGLTQAKGKNHFDSYHIPHMDDSIQSFGNATTFSILDAKNEKLQGKSLTKIATKPLSLFSSLYSDSLKCRFA